MKIHIFEEGFIPLPICFTTCSAYHRQENVSRPTGLNVDQLLFVLEGEGVLRHGKEEYPLRRGCAFYVAPHESHAYEGRGDLVTAWITWNGSGTDAIRPYIGSDSFVFDADVDVKKYAAELTRLEQEYTQSKREGLMSAMVYSLVMSFFEDRREKTLSDMDRVLRYMEAHFDRKVTLGELAALCHRSRSGFCKRFKEVFGMTAFEKLVEIRLYNADAMLRTNTADKISHIAAICGFEDVSYFCKAYKKKFGATPTERRSV
ncbi:MAG: helix-turn-helix domain-containing protein [Clostridia bacterium]|nr:helix-turn-helix domain-containing protein [Clostridia bacterium]